MNSVFFAPPPLPYETFIPQLTSDSVFTILVLLHPCSFRTRFIVFSNLCLTHAKVNEFPFVFLTQAGSP